MSAYIFHKALYHAFIFYAMDFYHIVLQKMLGGIAHNIPAVCDIWAAKHIQSC
jgi:hypothetical protein